MSVEFHHCEYCEESIYEENCFTRIIDGEEIKVCDWCIEEMTDSEKLIKLTEEDEGYESYSDEIKEAISDYEVYYKRTEKGITNEIQRIESKIKCLRNLLNKLKS